MSTFRKSSKLKVQKEVKVSVKKGKQNPNFKIKKVGILGYGEVGKAIHQVYKDVRKKFKYKIYIRDLDKNEFPKAKGGLDVLHICTPFNPHNDNFIQDSLENIKQYAQDGLVIIHSTVAVGTTSKIAEQHKFTVHSPVRGVHPHLAKGIQTFIKYVGSKDSGAGRIATEHLMDLNLRAMAVYKSEATELLKLLDTTYYGVCIAFHEYANKLCTQEGVNFDIVMEHANNSYNEGYYALGRPDVLRPILFAPTGEIGGHCVVPNANILTEKFGEHPLLKAILQVGKKQN